METFIPNRHLSDEAIILGLSLPDIIALSGLFAVTRQFVSEDVKSLYIAVCLIPVVVVVVRVRKTHRRHFFRDVFMGAAKKMGLL